LNLLVAERGHPLSDICTVTGNRIHQFVEAAMIEPLDLTRLPSWRRIDPLYAEAAWNSVNGARMGVPLVMGAEVLVYNSEKVVPPPDSWGAMFDARFRHKTAYVIEDFLQCTMLYQGADATFASYVETPDAAARAVDAARDMLIRNKGQVVKYYEDGSELQQLLIDEEVWLAQAYAGSLTRLILAGQPVRFVVPREGSLGFVYNFSVVKGAPNRDNAYRFLEALLAWPAIGPELSRSAGYTSTFIGAEAGLSERERAAFLLTQDQLRRIHFLSYEGQALSSKLIDRAVQEVQAA
jgi:spermidine/putrescine transport system substrate-binding protein